VIDLKLGAFKADFTGKMNLYVNALNQLIASSEPRTECSDSRRFALGQGPQ